MSFMIVLQWLFNMRPIDFVFVLKGMTKGFLRRDIIIIII